MQDHSTYDGPVTDPSVIRVTEPSGFVWTYDASDTELTRILGQERTGPQLTGAQIVAWPRQPVQQACFHCGGSGIRCCEMGRDR